MKKAVFVVAPQIDHSFKTNIDDDQTFTNSSKRAFRIHSNYHERVSYTPVFNVEKTFEKQKKNVWDIGSFHILILCDL